ncbi:hypothetical protein ACJJTC_014961 [Scirpophaga incertulas]
MCNKSITCKMGATLPYFSLLRSVSSSNPGTNIIAEIVTVGRLMDKKRPSRNKAMSIFQDASSRESTPDPFSDADGEYGSDQDYDPDPRTSSESDTSVNIQPSCSKNTRTTTSTHESSESDTSSSEDCSSNSASIFDTRIVKTQRVTVEIEPVNTDEATTVSMESLADWSMVEHLHGNPEPHEENEIPTPPSSPAAAERPADEAPLSPYNEDDEIAAIMST